MQTSLTPVVNVNKQTEMNLCNAEVKHFEAEQQLDALSPQNDSIFTAAWRFRIPTVTTEWQYIHSSLTL